MVPGGEETLLKIGQAAEATFWIKHETRSITGGG